MARACIVGWGHSPFVKADPRTVEELIGAVVREALADAGLAGEDVDELFVGQFNAGFDPQDFPSSLALAAAPGLRFKPATRVENACATGSAAIHQGLRAIESGRAGAVLVVGVEKMSGVPAARTGELLLRASYVAEEGGIRGGFAGVFARIAQLYFARHGDRSDALARIAAKNHANGVHNPYAQLRRDLGFEFCRRESERNPVVAPPLRRTDCSPVSDGAAALVLASEERLGDFRKAVGFRAAVQVNDWLPMSRRDVLAFEGPALAFRRALKEAGVALDDLDFAEVHDCFTIAELLLYEAMGLAPPGRGAEALEAGVPYRDGRLPVNVSGGLKAKGHPVGATGVSMHAIAAMQLTGEAGAMQLPGCELGAVLNMGGAAVASYASVLERRR